MTLFIIGLIILLGGGFFYSKYVESQLEPDDRETPAVKKPTVSTSLSWVRPKTGL